MGLRIKIAILTGAFFTLAAFLPVLADETPTPTPSPAPSQDSGKLNDLKNKISEYEKKVAELQGEAKTLKSQIAVMDNQIKLTEYRIDAAKEELLSLSADIDRANKKIGSLEKDLEELTNVLINRIIATYEVGIAPPFQVLLSSNTVSNFFTRLNYLKIAQSHDKRLIYETQQAKIDYANQKDIFEDQKDRAEALKQELEAYTAQLDKEKQSRQDLLSSTMNNEQKYQQLLNQARAEYLAIQGIVAGKGTEVEVGHVSEGDRIANVIQGSSCNSSGSHLHFTILKNGSAENPFSYLKSIEHKNCSGPGACSEGDPFNPSGSWNWPLDAPINFNQGYGSTWAIQNTWVSQIYSSHNGIDINSSSSTVKAVKEGTLFKGSYAVGCALSYVRVVHSDGVESLYLHVYP